jgi:hypothetical protein
MGLLYQVGITLDNISADWSNQIGYEISEIETNPYESEEERKIMLDKLKPFIDANTSISPKS